MSNHRRYIPRIFAVGLPLLISQMSQYLMSLADTAMVGRLGQTELAGMSIGATTSWLLFTFLWPVSVGVQAVAARRVGRNESGKESPLPLTPVLGAGLLVALSIFSIALAFSTTLKPLFARILSDQSVASEALSYVQYTRWAALFVGLGAGVQGIMNSLRKTRGIMVVSVTCNLLNILFNWILIFGKFGFPRMGLAGAGLSTMISLAIQVMGFWGLWFFRPSMKPYRLESLKPNFQLVKRILVLCLPVILQNGAAIFIMLVFNTMVENLGVLYLAVTQIIFTLFRINKTVVGGFARGAGILVGNALGAHDEDSAKKLVWSQQAIGLIIGLVVITLVLSIPGALVRIFTADPDVVELGKQALRFMAPFFFIEICAFSLELIFISAGWTRYVLMSELSTNLLFVLGLSFLLVFFTNLGIWGAWIGFAVYQIGHASILFGGWASGRWLRVRVEC
ncbi:MAG: MATE family efflux transporter [Spirochaetales bacterium]|nr:MATE family efflux transporter [Spirochaetales bacterium]